MRTVPLSATTLKMSQEVRSAGNPGMTRKRKKKYFTEGISRKSSSAWSSTPFTLASTAKRTSSSNTRRVPHARPASRWASPAFIAIVIHNSPVNKCLHKCLQKSARICKTTTPPTMNAECGEPSHAQNMPSAPQGWKTRTKALNYLSVFRADCAAFGRSRCGSKW
jgi:hypothetical protein